MAVMNQRNGMRAASSFDSAIDRLFNEVTLPQQTLRRPGNRGTTCMRHEHGMTVQLSLPGIEPKAISRGQGGHTHCEGERKWQVLEGRVWHTPGIPEGKFSTAFRLPHTMDAQRSTATYMAC
jgi:HSP20 family molecular chaperone IbpA